MATQRFPIRIGRRSAPLLRVLFGVKAAEADVILTEDDRFLARFGIGQLETPIENISRWRIEGPWRWITAIGIRRSMRNADFSFGGTPRGGVRVDFREHPRLLGFHPPALYITVDDLEGLAAALSARGIPGEDARTRIDP